MPEKQYLYGAAVQGIQGFIFQTNELRDIAGASELVERICTGAFLEMLGKKDDKDWADHHRIISAAGNVKYILNEEDCRRAVLQFPMKVMTMAPGITIGQAVVEYDEDEEKKDAGYFGQKTGEIERKLREVRNFQPAPSTIGQLGMERSLQTGLPLLFGKFRSDGIPACHKDKYEFMDAATLAKKRAANLKMLCAKSFGYLLLPEKGSGGSGNANDRNLVAEQSADNGNPVLTASSVSFGIKDLTGRNDWIAIIHADGNSLGHVIQKVGHKREDYQQFSAKLNEATIAAANDAFQAITPEIHTASALGNAAVSGAGKPNVKGNGTAASQEKGWKGRIPVRPVVLGGDDMTVIIRGDLAIEYVTAYMRAFESHTKKLLGDILTGHHVFSDGTDCLTTCAGIAFIKSSYPFYYGYDLAEALCEAAKKTAKAQRADKDAKVKSCLMFHKVQDSFIAGYDDIEKRELIPGKWPDGRQNATPDKGGEKKSFSRRNVGPAPEDWFSLKSGPYYINRKESPDGYLSIEELTDDAAPKLESNDAGINAAGHDRGQAGYNSSITQEHVAKHQGLVEKLDEREGVRSGIRQWLTLLHNGNGRAKQHLDRLFEQHKESKKLIEDLTTPQCHAPKDKPGDWTVPAQDALTLYTIKYQTTNSSGRKDTGREKI